MASAITYHPPLAPTEIQRQIPSVGAVCGKVARTALCGGREVTCVPTATAWHKCWTVRQSLVAPCPRANERCKRRETRGHGTKVRLSPPTEVRQRHLSRDVSLNVGSPLPEKKIVSNVGTLDCGASLGREQQRAAVTWRARAPLLCCGRWCCQGER